MNLRAIQKSAGYLVDQGSTSDVRALANLVMKLAKSTDELAQIIHDHECRNHPEFGVRLSDLMEFGQQDKPSAQCEACADHFTGPGQICPDCIERARRG